MRFDKLIWVYGIYNHERRPRPGRRNKWTGKVDYFDSALGRWQRIPMGRSHLFEQVTP